MHSFQSILIPILEHAIIIPVAHADSATTAQPGVLAMLGIDWKLFIAQLVNFAIVLLVLWKWVFTPLSKKLAERTERIEKSLREADDIKKLHQDAEKERLEMVKQARLEVSGIIAAGEVSAQKIKEDIISEARTNADRIIEDTHRNIEDQKTAMLKEIRIEASELIVSATEKIILEKLDGKKDKELIERSLHQVKDSSGGQA
jgi:F-type H+-transporting ATPase subunit b